MVNILYLIVLWSVAATIGTLGFIFTFRFSVIVERAQNEKKQKLSELKEEMLIEKSTKSMFFWGGLEYLENTELRMIYRAFALVALVVSLIMNHINTTQYHLGVFVMLSILVLFFNFFFCYAAKKDMAKFENENKSSIPIELTLPKELV